MNILIKVAIGLWVVAGLHLIAVIYHSFKGSVELADKEAFVGSACSIVAAVLSLLSVGGI